MAFRIGGVTFKRETSGALHLRWRNGTMRFGKTPYPDPDAQDALSRLALAYGVRRDMFDTRDAIRDHLGLKNDAATSQTIQSVIIAIIDAYRRDRHAVDRLAAGHGIPDWAKDEALKRSGIWLPNPEEVVESALTEMARALHAAESDGLQG